MNSTNICNLALSALGKGQIQSINEQSEMARQCNMRYDHVRGLLLREFDWGFAKRLLRGAPLAAVYPGWRYVYAYPELCLSLRCIFNDRGVRRKTFGRKEYDTFLVTGSAQAIGCNVDKAWFEYTYDVRDAELFPADFTDALIHRLAADMAVLLTGSERLRQQEYQLYQMAIYKAMVTTSNERHERTKFPAKYLKARGGD